MPVQVAEAHLLCPVTQPDIPEQGGAQAAALPGSPVQSRPGNDIKGQTVSPQHPTMLSTLVLRLPKPGADVQRVLNCASWTVLFCAGAAQDRATLSEPREGSAAEQAPPQIVERQLLPVHEHIIVGLPGFWAVASPDAAALRAHFYLRVCQMFSADASLDNTSNGAKRKAQVQHAKLRVRLRA